jgi:protein ImuB
VFERLDHEQIQLLEHEQHAGEVELAHLIERLSVRLGEEAIVQAEMVASYVPEKAFLWHGFSTRAGDSRARVENPCHEVVRPLHLLHWPTEIGVIASPSHEPASFTHRGEVHRLIHSTGPERIAGQWWEGHHKTRDYFDVEDAVGKRFWIFRVAESGKWYLHGEFE